MMNERKHCFPVCPIPRDKNIVSSRAIQLVYGYIEDCQGDRICKLSSLKLVALTWQCYEY